DAVDAQLALLEPMVRALRPAWVLTNADLDPDARAGALLARCAERLGAHGARLAVEFLPFLRVRSIGGALELVRRSGSDAGVLVPPCPSSHGPGGWGGLGAPPRAPLA